MDTVTYQDSSVKAELEKGYKRLVIDVSKRRDVAKIFDIAVVPVAVILHPDGRILEKIQGFVEPAKYAVILRETRE